MKFVDFEGSFDKETLLQLSAMEDMYPPRKGKESILTTHEGKVYLFTPDCNSEKNYYVQYVKGYNHGGFFNGVCETEEEVMKIIDNLHKAKGTLEVREVFMDAVNTYGRCKNSKDKSFSF